MFLQSFGNGGQQSNNQFESFRILIVNSEWLVEQRKKFPEIDELVVDVFDDEVHLAGLFEKLENFVESVRGYLGVTLSVLLIAAGKDLADEVDTRRVFLLYLNAEFLEIV